MSRKRVAVAVFMASCLAAFAAAPFPAMGAEVGSGTTSTNIDLVDVTLSNVPELGNLRANLGVATSDATTKGTPNASVLLDAIRVGNQVVSAHEASSSDGDSSKSVEIPLGVAGIDGSITIADMSASADADSALAVLNALSSSLNVGPIGFSAQTGDNGVISSVTPTEAMSRAGASFGPIDLSVGDLLPAEVMEALPLSALLDLIDGLGITLPTNITDQIQVVRDLMSVLDDVDTKIAELQAARQDLEELVSDNDAVQAAQQIVDDAQAAFDAAQAQLAQAQAAFDAAQAAVTTVQGEATVAHDALTAATNEVAGITSQMSALQAQKAALEGQLPSCTVEVVCNDLRAQIAVINAQIATAQTQLDSAQAAATAANAEAANADAAVTQAQGAVAAAGSALQQADAALDAAQSTLATALSDLQAAIDSIVNPIVDQALALIEQIQGELDALLDTLEQTLSGLSDLTAMFDDIIGLLSDAPLFKVGQIAVTVDAVADRTSGVATVTCGASGIEILGNSIAGESCETLAGAFAQVRGAIMDVLGSLPVADSLPAINISGLKSSTEGSQGPDASGVTSAVARLTGLHIGIGSVALGDMVDDILAEVTATLQDTIATLPTTGTPVDGALQSAVDQVMAQIDGLPLGDTLNGLRTVGIDATVAGMRTMATYQARSPRTETPRAPGNNPGDDTPPVVSPPAERPTLPFTGSPTSLMVALALWLMSAGMVLTYLSQRRVATEDASN